MSINKTQKPALGALIMAWVCGRRFPEPNGLDTASSGDDIQATLKLIYDEARLALEIQRDQRAILETKASILVGFAGTVLALLISALDTLIAMPHICRWLILLGIALLILSLFLLGLVFWVRQQRVDPDPVSLAEAFIDVPIEDTRRQVIANRIASWKENKVVIERSAKYLKGAFLLQGSASVFLTVALLLSVFPG